MSIVHPEGVLKPLLLLTKAGLSGPIGRGTQVWPWISLDDEVRAHTWVSLQFRAVESTYPIHRYEVRLSDEPITDMESFLRGRPAKEATTAKDGPFGLMLPVDVPETLTGQVSLRRVDQGVPVDGQFDLSTEAGRHFKGAFLAEWGNETVYCG